jgi:hypothetical protein
MVGSPGAKVRSLVAAVAGLVLFMGDSSVSAAPREQLPEPPPERTEVIAFDLDAFAASIADLPDPLPAPPTDGSFQTCTDVGAHPATYPLFDGQSVAVPPRRHADLCAVAGADGPRWTLSWSGVLQDPAVPGAGGWLASGLWTLIASEDGWLAALGSLDEGAQFDYRSENWDTPGQVATLEIVGRYLDRSHFYAPLPPLVVQQTVSTTVATASVASARDAPPAQAVSGTPGYTG